MNRTVPAILFSEFSNFHVGIKDLKRRTGSWRVYQILATISLAVWIGLLILLWLGLSSWNNLSIVFLVQFAFSVIGLAYLSLYHLPRKRVPHNRDDSEMMGVLTHGNILFIFPRESCVARVGWYASAQVTREKPLIGRMPVTKSSRVQPHPPRTGSTSDGRN